MLRYIAIRIACAVPILFGVSVVNATVICLSPAGSAIACGPGMPADACTAWRKQNGQDKSCAEQYATWAHRMFVVEPAYQLGLFDNATSQE